jgi:hypothetical protein
VRSKTDHAHHHHAVTVPQARQGAAAKIMFASTARSATPNWYSDHPRSAAVHRLSARIRQNRISTVRVRSSEMLNRNIRIHVAVRMRSPARHRLQDRQRRRQVSELRTIINIHRITTDHVQNINTN